MGMDHTAAVTGVHALVAAQRLMHQRGVIAVVMLWAYSAAWKVHFC